MSYYPTLTEDVARAKAILDRGKIEPTGLSIVDHVHFGGTIYGADTFAAYQLLESFVAAIEAVGPKVCELAMRHEALRAKETP